MKQRWGLANLWQIYKSAKWEGLGIIENQGRGRELKQTTLPVVNKLALREGVAPRGIEPLFPE